MDLPQTSSTTISFEPEHSKNNDVQWDFEPWDQAQKSDWQTWKPVPGSMIVFEKDRFGRALRPRAVVIDFTPIR